jgi:hypothetical protein
MTPNQTIILVKAFHQCTTTMGLNPGTKQITTFTISTSLSILIIKSYGHIKEFTLKTACERFCKPGKPEAQTCIKQNNKMMSICLAKSDAQ